jgi:hypothetical protein
MVSALLLLLNGRFTLDPAESVLGTRTDMEGEEICRLSITECFQLRELVVTGGRPRLSAVSRANLFRIEYSERDRRRPWVLILSERRGGLSELDRRLFLLSLVIG